MLRGAGGGPGEPSEQSQDEGGSGGNVTASLPVIEGTALDLLIGEPGILGTNSGSEVPGLWRRRRRRRGHEPRRRLRREGAASCSPRRLTAARSRWGRGRRQPGVRRKRWADGWTRRVQWPARRSGSQHHGTRSGKCRRPERLRSRTETTAIEGRGGGGGPAVAPARSGGGGGGGYYGGGGGGTETWGAVSGGGGGSDYVTPSATGVGFNDGAGGAGGEDTADPAQPGEVEVIYSEPVEAPVTAGQTSSAAALQLPAAHHGERPSPHLTVYTRGGQGVINARALTIKASCGGVACRLRAIATLHVRGLSHLPALLSPVTSIAASSVGKASLPVPKALRSRLRHYLLHHRGAHIRIELTVRATASSGGSSRETLAESLPMWTLPGLR